MQVIPFLSEKQRGVVDLAKRYGSLNKALHAMRVSRAEVDKWRSDPDVSLALDLAEAEGNAKLYMKAMEVVGANLELNDLNAAQMVLKAVEPEKWNPAHKIQVEAEVRHRFIDFTGREIHAEQIESNSDNG